MSTHGKMFYICNKRSTYVILSIYFSYVCRTDPADVARVESKTWMCTNEKYDSVPHVREGIQGILGQWKEPEEAEKHLEEFKNCMAGMWADVKLLTDSRKNGYKQTVKNN